jgi:hypothetical protein
MGWSGIWLIHVPDDVTPRQAVDATIDGWFANPAVPGSHLMAVPDPVEITLDPEWAAKVKRAIYTVNPNLRRTEYGYHDDGVGPVMIYIYEDQAQLLPKKQWDDPVDMDGFAVMWDYCVAVADATGCVAHDADDDEIIDLSLDVETARRRYRWI